MVLDELNPTVDLELLSVEPIAEALLQKPHDTEIIITGPCHKPTLTLTWQAYTPRYTVTNTTAIGA